GEQRAITLGIQRQPGTNTIAVADAVKALLPQFKLELPSSIHMDVLYDRSDTIRESYRDVQFTMLLTLALVIMVIFVFLRNVWATVIPSLALPFSIIGTFAVMYMGGVLGRLFRAFSVTICVAILISGVVSVTLTPMLCSLFLKKPHKHGEKTSKFGAVTERGFDGLLRGYDRTLQMVLRYRPATMVAFVVVLLLTGLLFVIVPKGFIPDQDTDQIAVTTEA